MLSRVVGGLFSVFLIVWWILGITLFDIPDFWIVVWGIIWIPIGLLGIKVSLTNRL